MRRCGLRFGLIVLVLGLAACAAETKTSEIRAPTREIGSFQSVIVRVPLTKRELTQQARDLERQTASAIRKTGRWRLVLEGSTATGQKNGLRIRIDLLDPPMDFSSQVDPRKETYVAVTLEDIATGEVLGGMEVVGAGIGPRQSTDVVVQQISAWVSELP